LRSIFKAVACLVCSLALVQGAHAQQTNRPLRLLVPTSPGSSADIGARAVAERLQVVLGRAVITENRTGAGGSLAAAAVSAAEPSGDTVGVLGNSYLLFHVEYPQQKFQPARDVVPVALISRGSNVLVVAGGSAYTSVQDLLQRAKANPGKVTFASAGVGSSSHHSAERLVSAAGLDVLHVPYKGAPEMVQEVLAGRIDFAFVPVSAAIPFLQGGRARALAVSSSKRTALMPEIPTTVEAGLEGSTYDTWLVALVPAKTPRATQTLLNKAFNAAVQTPEVKQRFATLGLEADPRSLDDVQSFVRSEYEKALAQSNETKSR
jgi:tripartite-type tricarboxylate transporter receptor subunit TctC